jgi:hypothetical protein
MLGSQDRPSRMIALGGHLSLVKYIKSVNNCIKSDYNSATLHCNRLSVESGTGGSFLWYDLSQCIFYYFLYPQGCNPSMF